MEPGQPLPRDWWFVQLSQTDSRLHGPLLIDGTAYVLAYRDGKRVGSDALLFDPAPLAKLLSNTVSFDVEALSYWHTATAWSVSNCADGSAS